MGVSHEVAIKILAGSSHSVSVETNLNNTHACTGSIPGLTQWVKYPALLWLWCRPAATTLIQPLAWEPPYAVGVALKKKRDIGWVVSSGVLPGAGGSASKLTYLAVGWRPQFHGLSMLEWSHQGQHLASPRISDGRKKE